MILGKLIIIMKREREREREREKYNSGLSHAKGISWIFKGTFRSAHRPVCKPLLETRTVKKLHQVTLATYHYLKETNLPNL